MQVSNLQHPIQLLALAIVIAMLGACEAAPRTSGDYDRSADFGSFKSFAFLADQPGQPEEYSTLLLQHLKSATRGQLESRGYVLDNDDPDLLVNFTIIAKETVRVDSYPVARPYWGGRYDPWRSHTEVRQYTEGTLMIDLIDARKKQVAWQGIAQGTLTESKLKNMAERVPRVVAAIFTEYPFDAT